MIRTKHYYILLVILSLFLYLPGIAKLSLFDRDEPHFAQASRQMIENHNYWQINFQDKPRHLKPPGIYWLQSAAVRLLSSAESIAPWPYRLPSVLGALLASLLTFGLGRRLTDEVTAFIAAILLSCSVLLIIEAHLAVTDAALLATVALMQWSLGIIYLKYIRQKPCSYGWPLVFWVSMASGVLIKGITPLIAALTMIGISMGDRDFSWLKSLRWPWGLPLLLILTSAWVIPFSFYSGHNFLWEMIKADALPKLTGNQQSHGMPPGFFLVILTPAFWPGSLFFVPAGVWTWFHRKEPLVKFLLGWILPVWLFFEIVHTKLPEYILPIFPAISMLIALVIHEGLPAIHNYWLKILLLIQQFFWLICTLSFMFVAIYFKSWLTFILILIGGSYLLYHFYKNHFQNGLILGVILTACAWIPFLGLTLPKAMYSINTSEQIRQIIDNNHYPVFAIDYQEPSLVFLLGTDAVNFISWKQATALLKPNSIVLVSEKNLNKFHNVHWQTLGIASGLPYRRHQFSKIYVIQISSGTS